MFHPPVWATHNTDPRHWVLSIVWLLRFGGARRATAFIFTPQWHFRPWSSVTLSLVGRALFGEGYFSDSYYDKIGSMCFFNNEDLLYLPTHTMPIFQSVSGWVKWGSSTIWCIMPLFRPDPDAAETYGHVGTASCIRNWPTCCIRTRFASRIKIQ